MTTLELATAIAYAVIQSHVGFVEDPDDATVQSVLDTLRRADAWFCRVTMEELPDGTHGETQQSLFEDV